jgi:heterodisulfide reductase subunit A-like polyferredoxin
MAQAHAAAVAAPHAVVDRPLPSDGAGSSRPVAASAAAPVARPPRTVAVVVHPEDCTQCEACLDACDRGAIALDEAPVVDTRLCTGCGACEDACPNGVLALGGA